MHTSFTERYSFYLTLDIGPQDGYESEFNVVDATHNHANVIRRKFWKRWGTSELNFSRELASSDFSCHNKVGFPSQGLGFNVNVISQAFLISRCLARIKLCFVSMVPTTPRQENRMKKADHR